MVNNEFHYLCTYFRRNKLSIHPDKTKFLLILHNNIITQPHHTLYINNNNLNENLPQNITKLSRVSDTDNLPAIKYLGVYFDQNLNFKCHISHISKKLSYALYALRQEKNFLPPAALKTLYYSLFHCHLIYAIEIWSNVTDSLLKPLITKQKAAIRLLANQSYNVHTEPLFKALSNILPLQNLITHAKLKIFYSFHFNTTPTAFHNTGRTTLEQRHLDGNLQHLINLRNNNDYFSPPARTTFISRFPLFNLPLLWNNTPDHLKDITNQNSFSFNLKNTFWIILVRYQTAINFFVRLA